MAVQAIRVTLSFALSMFCKPENYPAMQRLLDEMYTPKHATLPAPCSSGGVNDPPCICMARG